MGIGQGATGMKGRSAESAGAAGVVQLFRDGLSGIMPDVAEHLPPIELSFTHTRWVVLAAPLILYLYRGRPALVPALAIAGVIVAMNLFAYGVLSRWRDRFEAAWVSVRFAELGIIAVCAAIAHQWLGAQEFSAVMVFPVLCTALVAGLWPIVSMLVTSALLLFLSSAYLHSTDPLYWQWSQMLREDGAVFLYLVAVAMIGLCLAGLVRQARRIAGTDPLTGLANRRHFVSRLNRALRRSGGPVCVILIDLDHFKSVNDRFGHPGGDRVLRTVASVVRDCAGDALVARLGGEEFAVLVAGSRDQAQVLAGMMLARVRETGMIVGPGEICRVTASAGAAEGWSGRTDAATLLHQADQALYRAKACGRDRAEHWQPDMRRAEAPDLHAAQEPAPSLLQWLRAGSSGIGWRETQGWSSLELVKSWLRWAAVPAVFLLPAEGRGIGPAVAGLLILNNCLAAYSGKGSARVSVVRGMVLRLVDIVIIGMITALVHNTVGNTILNGYFAIEIVLATALAGWQGHALASGAALLFIGMNTVRHHEGPILIAGYLVVHGVVLVYLGQMVMLLVGMEVRQSRQEALVDGLTGAATRLGFQHRVREAAAAAEAGRSWAVVAADIDDFKCVNDQWGHLTGDLVLRQVAKVMMAQAEPAEAVGRFGGEEFIFFTPEGPDRARRWVADVQRELQGSRMWAGATPSDGGDLSVTLSFGLARMQGSESLNAALERADSALYEAKATGKNRIVEGYIPVTMPK